MPNELLVNIMTFMDTDTQRKITTISKQFADIWEHFPQVWQTFNSEDDYLGTRVVTLLEDFVNNVCFFTAKFKYEYPGNKSLNHIFFQMYNLLKLNLAGCQIVYNVDFLQVMTNLSHLNLTRCPNMSTTSLIRSVNSLHNLEVFICRDNDVRVSSYSIYQAVRGLENLQELDCCNSEMMRPWLVCKLLFFCESVCEFRFTTLFSLDGDRAKISWYKIVKVLFPHVTFMQRVQDKVAEYMLDCKPVKMEALVEDWVQQALEFNPEQY